VSVEVSGSPTVVIVVVRTVVRLNGAKQRHSHRFLISGDAALTIGCVIKGGEAIT
jgi:hypothetical protein